MLKDINLKNSYTSGFDEPKFFFTEALLESMRFDLGLGFFSSSGIKALAPGFAVFVANGGVMRVIINQFLSEQDKAAIELGQSGMIEAYEQQIISDIKTLQAALSGPADVFFKCFSYLISINRIEFVATISTKGGLAHDKYGIFTDANGDKISFIGSANWSKTAMELNGETITAFSSWADKDRVYEYQDLFDSSWNTNTPHLIHIPMSRVKEHIRETYKVNNVAELINDGLSLVNKEKHAQGVKNRSLPEYLINLIEAKSAQPRFPFPEERDIQKHAYKSWQDNNYNGIFAMATGSGKTVTALNCLLKQYNENNYYKAIIVVPTQALAIQWEKEAQAFNFQNIISTHTEKDWKTLLSRYSTRSILDQKKNIVIITTYATYNRKHFQEFLKTTKGIDSFIYIADEAHNLGSATSLKYLPTQITHRIGLSATPERIYDEIGSSKMYDFFNSRPPQYTYRYTMKQAIDDEILCKYEYYPIFIELTDVEMSEYERITAQLRMFIDSDTGTYKPEADMLLLKRKRVVHKAANKKTAILQLLNDLQDNGRLDYTFVFVPEGYEPNYSDNETYEVDSSDIHIIDEYAQIFKDNNYSYHKYISGLDDAPGILKGFSDGDIQILLSMKCLDEGVDVPRAEHAIFCSSTGNPRQFVQRRGRVLRQHKDKDKAYIWDLIVMPPNIYAKDADIERNLFQSEVKRIVNFAALAENKISILYGELKDLCEHLRIDLFNILESEYEQYK